MPPGIGLCRLLSAIALLISTTTAQQCYYPDGSPSLDVPCSAGNTSSCCGADAFCMENGLCFGDGIVSRGSCTDESWGSEACTPYCRSASPDSSVPLALCSVSSNTSVFVCGLQTSCNSNSAFIMQGGSSFVLRPAQVAAIAGPALASANAVCSSSKRLYTLTDLIGVVAGLGVPLVGTIIASVLIVRRQARRRKPSSLLYTLPDGYKSDIVLSSPPLPRSTSRPGTGGTNSHSSTGAHPSLSSAQHSPSFSAQFPTNHYSDGISMRSPMSGFHSPPPMNLAGYAERYASFKTGDGSRQVSGIHTREMLTPHAELEGESLPVELAARTKSNKSTRSGQSARSGASGRSGQSTRRPRHEMG